MKIGMQEYVDVATGVQDDFDVEIEANAVAIYAQISGLAKDKIGYAIRELPTNAWDESRDNYEVHLPTRLNPVFRVRDYGRGISPEDMRNVYGKLYASTKRAGNDQVGGWGLGSKSPFAYLLGPDGAGSFNVVSYHQGMMRAYVISLSAEGKIKIRMMVEAPSDEPSGLDVSYAVRREDISDFHERATKILWSFNPRPRMFPESAITWNEPVIESQGEKWIRYKPRSVPFSGPRVRMGCVMYPFDLSQIENSGFLANEDVVLFEAPIGSLKVILSREELAYDETTKTTLKSLVAEYENSFIEQVRLKVAEANSLFEAAKIFEDETDSLGSSRQERLRKLIRWEGRPMLSYVLKEDCKVECLPEGWSTFEKFEDGQARAKWAADATIVIEHNPSYSLSRFHMAQLVGKKILWVRCKRAVRDQVLERLGNPEVVDLDSYKVPVTKRVSKTIRKRKTIMITPGGRLHRLTQDVDLAAGGFIVEATLSNGRRRRGNDYLRLTTAGHNMSFSDAESVIMTAFEFGLIEVGTVILVKDWDKDVSGDWHYVGDDFIDQLRERVDVSEFTGLHKKQLGHLNHNLQDLKKMNERTPFSTAPEEVRNFLGDLATLYNALETNSTASTQSDKAFAALKKLGVEVNKPDVACPIAAIQERYEALCTKYMLLRSIVEEHNYYSRNAVKAEKLSHYFELLARPAQPAAANDNQEAVEDEIALDEAA